jgi:hypothetical protein
LEASLPAHTSKQKIKYCYSPFIIDRHLALKFNELILNYLELPRFIRDGVAVVGGQEPWALLLFGTSALSFQPGSVVHVDFAANCPRLAFGQVLLGILRIKKINKSVIYYPKGDLSSGVLFL